MCQSARTIVSKTRRMNSSGTSAWNRSDIELTKIRRGFRHVQRQLEALRPEAQVEALLVGMAGHAAEALGERERVAVVAAGRDLGAAGDRVPRRVGPLDR